LLRPTCAAQSAAAKLREVEHKSAALLDWYQRITGLSIAVAVRARPARPWCWAMPCRRR